MTSDLIVEFLEWQKKTRKSPRTIHNRSEILRRMDRQLPVGLESATPDELREWIFKEGHSKNTLCSYYGAAAAFFAWATNPHNPRLDYNPMGALEDDRPSAPRGLPRPVTDAELERILTMAAEPYRTWSLLAAYEGLRCIEIAHMDREHVTQQETLVAYGKGDKPAVLPTHPVVWAAMRDLPPGPVAVTPRGDRASAYYVSIRTAMHFRRDLEMQGVAMHRLRHWYGTNLMRRTGNLRTVQEMLRHATPTTTAVYTLVTSEERTAAALTLPVFEVHAPR